MTAPERNARRWTLAALVALGALSLFWLVDAHFHSTWDAVLYVLSGRSLLAGEGYAVYGEPFTLRPPGFSVLVAAVMGVFGEANFFALNLFTSLVGLAAIAAMFAYVQPRLGNPIAFALCASIWFSPQYQSLCVSTLSDTAGLLMLFGCLGLDRRARASKALTPDVTLALALAFGLYLRSVFVLLIPALVAGRLLQRAPAPDARSASWRRIALLIGLPLLLYAPWPTWKSVHTSDEPPQLWGIHSYSTAQWHQDPTDPTSPYVTPGRILWRIPWRARQIATALGSRLPKLEIPGILGRRQVAALRIQNQRPGGFVLGVVGLLCLVGSAWRRRCPGDGFVLANLAVLSIYFDFDERLLVPVYPFVLAAACEACRLLAQRWFGASRSAFGIAMLVGAMGLADMFPRFDRATIVEQDRAHRTVAEWVEARYSPEVAVGASLGHKLAVYFGRPVRFCEVALGHRGLKGFWHLAAEHRLRVLVFTGENNFRLKGPLNLLCTSLEVVHEIGEIRILEFQLPAGAPSEATVTATD